MPPPSTHSNSIGRWALVVIATLTGILTLVISGNLVLVVMRGGIASAQWQFGLVPLFVIAIAFAITAGKAITYRPVPFPKPILPALLACNAILIVYLLFRFNA
jgi:hypothetical protein